MNGWEIAGLFFGGVGTAVVTFILKDAFFKGKQSAALVHFTGTMNQLVAEMKEVNSVLTTHEEKISAMSKVHTKVDESIDRLDATNIKILQQLASSDATMKGVQQLLQLILDGRILPTK